MNWDALMKACDKKIADNTRLNKEIPRRRLLVKPGKRMDILKTGAGFYALSPSMLALEVASWI